MESPIPPLGLLLPSLPDTITNPFFPQVDGNETLGDNICDNAGVLNAWLAYTRWKERFGEEPYLPGMNYTVPQVFFITFAQVRGFSG